MFRNLWAKNNLNTSNNAINKYAQVGQPINNLYNVIGQGHIILTNQDLYMENQDEKILIYEIDNNKLMIITLQETKINSDSIDIIKNVIILDKDQVIDQFKTTYFKSIKARV